MRQRISPKNDCGNGWAARVIKETTRNRNDRSIESKILLVPLLRKWQLL
jgi:hypothetical protein